MQAGLMALIDEMPANHEPEAVGGTGDEDARHAMLLKCCPTQGLLTANDRTRKTPAARAPIRIRRLWPLGRQNRKYARQAIRVIRA
jgi:hypothetical protein